MTTAAEGMELTRTGPRPDARHPFAPSEGPGRAGQPTQRSHDGPGGHHPDDQGGEGGQPGAPRHGGRQSLGDIGHLDIDFEHRYVVAPFHPDIQLFRKERILKESGFYIKNQYE